MGNDEREDIVSTMSLTKSVVDPQPALLPSILGDTLLQATSNSYKNVMSNHSYTGPTVEPPPALPISLLAATPHQATSSLGEKKESNKRVQNKSKYADNTSKHLKKGDGEPLLRKDLQYDFLKAVFEDDEMVVAVMGHSRRRFVHPYSRDHHSVHEGRISDNP